MCVLSVIIPVYNGEKHLSYAVESIINQPMKDIEILIVNDGSNDSTPELCEKLKETYPCVRIFHQINQGVSAARNTGLKNARGKYILFLDVDDFIVPGVLSIGLQKRLEQEPVDVFMFSSLVANVKKNRFRIDVRFPDRMFAGRQIFPLSGTFASCFYRKDFLFENDIWFDEGVSLNEDQVFKIKSLYMAKHIEASSRFCYVYCNTPGSIMHTMDKKIDRVTAWRCVYEWFENHLEGQEREKVLSYVQVKIQSRMLLYAQNYIQSGNSEESLIEELKAQNGLELLENIDVSQVMPYQREDLRLFQTDRKAFVRKAKKEGLKVTIGRFALRIRLIRWIRDRKQYPLTEIPEAV